MKATALERYPICFPEPGSEADTASERGTAGRLSGHQRPRWDWATWPLGPVCLRLRKALVVGLSAGQLTSPNVGLLGQVMLDNNKHLPLPAQVA